MRYLFGVGLILVLTGLAVADGMDYEEMLLADSDVVVVGEFSTEPVRKNTNKDLYHYHADFKIGQVIKWDAPDEKKVGDTINVNVVRTEREPDDRLPELKQGGKCLLLLKVHQLRPTPSYIAATWYGVQRPSPALAKQLSWYVGEQAKRPLRVPVEKDIDLFYPEPVRPTAHFKFKVEKADLVAILRDYRAIPKQDWHHNYSHVAFEDRTGTIFTRDGTKIRYLVRPGGLATLTFRDGRKLYLARGNGIDRPAKDAKENSEVRRFEHGSYIHQVAFSPDGKIIATDHQLWEAATSKKLGTLPLPGHVDCFLAFSPDSRRVAIHRYEDIVVFDIAADKIVLQIRLLPRGSSAYAKTPGIIFTPDGKHLVSARNDEGLVRVWSADTGKEIRNFPYAMLDGGLSGAVINSLAVCPDGKQIVLHRGVSIEKEGPVVLDFETGKELNWHRVKSGDSWIRHSVSTPDCRHLIYAKDNGLTMIDLKTGEEVRRFEADGKHSGLAACSANGKLVACGVQAKGGKENWIVCWELSTGKTVRTIKGLEGHRTSLVFSPDSEYLLSGGDDKTARLWRVK